MKRLALTLGVLTLALAACGGSGSGDGDSGIRGQALAGPQCPVEVAGSPCPPVPWEGTVVATDTETGDEFTVETDTEGRFELPLAPATYELSIRSESVPPFAKPATAMVKAGSFTQVTISVDTGIR